SVLVSLSSPAVMRSASSCTFFPYTTLFRSGRILGNRLQFMTNSSRDEVLYQMRYMNLEKPFRTSYVYNNVMYSLAGQIIEYTDRSEEHTSELQSRFDLVCRLLLEKKRY